MRERRKVDNLLINQQFYLEKKKIIDEPIKLDIFKAKDKEPEQISKKSLEFL